MPLSVVICTHRPVHSPLNRVLDSLEHQAPTINQWELVLVLNGPAANADAPCFPTAPLRILRQEECDLTNARIAAFEVTENAPGYVLVDDDTLLATDYLQNAESLLLKRPDIGAAGGRIVADFSGPCPDWLWPSLGNLAVRDLGRHAIVSTKLCFGPWMPVGAG